MAKACKRPTWFASVALPVLALAASSPVVAARTTITPPLAPPYAGAYQPVGKDEIGLWQRDDEAEKHLAASAQLVQAKGGNWTNQGEAGDEREDQRQHVVTERQPEQNETDDGIYYN